MNHYKKTIILLIISIFLAGSATAQYTLQDEDVVVNSDGVLTTFSNTTQKNIVIPTMLDGQTITSIGGDAFYNNALTSVDLSGLTSLTSIGGSAFADNALPSVDLSGLMRLTSIGDGAFQGNSLPSFTLPPSTVGYTTPSWDVFNSFSFITTTLAAEGSATDVASSYTLNPENSDPITYGITYVLDGGTNAAANPANYTAASTITLAVPTRRGYYLLGWYTESAFTNEVTGITAGSTGAKTFYAKWEVSYTLQDYDVVVRNGVLTTFSNMVEKNILIPAILDGQTITSIGENAFRSTSQDNALTRVDFSGLTSLTSIGFSAFRDNALMSFTLPPSTVGYTMPSWDVSGLSSSTITTLSAGGLATDVSKSYTLNLAASDPIIYAITYVLDGGINAARNPVDYTVESTITLAAPTREGYTFLGWYTEGAFTNKVTAIATGSTGAETFYAKWEAE